MAVHVPELTTRAVLAHYPVALRGGALTALWNHGGFSGARLWQLESVGGALCLRAWPEPGPGAERLRFLHHLMSRARAEGLAFVPALLRTTAGTTWVDHAGRLWELTTWQPGRADFHERPTLARLQAACTALARVHTAWKEVRFQRAPCPAIQRRLAAVREWQAMLRAGWRPRFAPDDPVRPWAERAWEAVQARIDLVPRRLAAWADQPLPVQPCLCDVWHDHVLFEADDVTGLIDYGSVKLDHVAVDLARLLGSLVGDCAERQAAGLDEYGRILPLSADERALVALLNWTGTLLGAANWLKWLYRDGKPYEDRAAVARRLAVLVERIERAHELA
jgi:Ser/Thr protein kinase RdoA (MazF antagonist)